MIIGGRAHNLEQIREVAELGYPYAEVSLLEPSLVEREFMEMAEFKSRYGITYLAHYPNEGNPIDVPGLKDTFVPKMKKLFDLSQQLGIHKGTMHFWIDTRWIEQRLVSQKIALLRDLVNHAVERGIVLCIENLSERYDSFVPAFDAIEDLRMTLDIGHAQLLAKENTSYDFIRHVFDRIAHVHVHDNHGGTSVKDDVHLALGEGIVDYPRILTRLKEHGYSSTITMEVKPCDMTRTWEAVHRYI